MRWPPKSKIFLFVCTAAVIVLGFGPFSRAPSLEKHFGNKVEFKGVIGEDPMLSDKSLRFVFHLNQIAGEEIDSRVMVTLPRYPEYHYGDELLLKGKLATVSEFNRKSNASAETVFPEVLAFEPGHGNVFKASLYKIKAIMLRVTERILPEPQSALNGGILLGTKNFSDELSEDFRTTGTAHIVAISGFNVTIVANIIDSILRRFGRRISFYGSVLGVVSLVIITGAQASVVRAGIMGSVGLIAKQLGRMNSGMNAVMLTALIMLVQNPRLLQFDLGFQLSFAALAGLMFVQPYMDEKFPSFPLKEHLFPTTAAQISTTPLLLYNFGNFSFISIFTNLLVLPVIPWAMLIGFISVVVGMAIPQAGLAVGAAAWFVLTYVIKVIQICADIPGAAVSGVPFPLWAAILYYLILIAILKWKPKRSGYSRLS
jgi:competence protein ComEC